MITTDGSQMRHLPKAVWLLIVLLIPDIGSIVWLVVGHDWSARRVVAPTRLQSEFPQYDRPGRHVATNPDDDEAFLRQVRARAEEQRRQGDELKKKQRPPEQ